MDDPWIYRRQSSRGRMRLFCFPYAGGSAAAYSRWQERLPDDIEVCALELPGRRNRLHETPFRRIPLLVDAIAHCLTHHIDLPYAFFGHSLGAVIAFEVTRCMRRLGHRGPGVLFLSGAAAPHLPTCHRALWSLPDDELVTEIKAFGGTPEEILEDPDMMRVFLPALRADFELFETYTFLPAPDPLTGSDRLATPTWVLGGDADKRVSPSRLAAWVGVTDVVSVEMFAGGHFFLHERRDAVLATTERELDRLLRALI